MNNPLHYDPSQKDAYFNIRVTITSMVAAQQPIVGYVKEFPVRGPAADLLADRFLNSFNLKIFGAHGEVIHIGADVVTRSVISSKIIDVREELNSIIEPEPMPLPVIG